MEGEPSQAEDSMLEGDLNPSEPPKDLDSWIIYLDEPSCEFDNKADIILNGPNGDVSKHAIRFHFWVSSNQVEYEAVIIVLKLSLRVKVTKAVVLSDSRLVVSHINEEYEG